MRLRFTSEAQEHIAAIYNYVGDRNPVAAAQVVARMRAAAEQLADFPRMGRAGRAPNTHEWVMRGLPYIIVYQPGAADPDMVDILGIFHAAQDRESE